MKESFFVSNGVHVKIESSKASFLWVSFYVSMSVNYGNILQLKFSSSSEVGQW